jgi:TPR repeat protein
MPPRSHGKKDDHFSRASALWESGRIRAAFRLFVELAERDDTNAQVNLGHFYERGLATKRNMRAARHWYRAAALNGDSSGSYNMGIADIQARRYKHAVKWLRMSVRQGAFDALIPLAELYISGRGVARSAGRAASLLVKALESDGLTPSDRRKAQKLIADIRQ